MIVIKGGVVAVTESRVILCENADYRALGHLLWVSKMKSSSVFVHLDFDVCDGWGNVLQRQYHHITVSMHLARLIYHILFLGHCFVASSFIPGKILECFQHIKGHQFAKSAFDCAWWDAFSKYKKQPLWKLIGGVNQTVSVGADFPVQETSAELFSKVDQAVMDGFRRIKIKFNPNQMLPQ